jgi:hypothetical protein
MIRRSVCTVNNYLPVLPDLASMILQNPFALRYIFYAECLKVQGLGIEPRTSAVLRPRHNQLDHPCLLILFVEVAAYLLTHNWLLFIFNLEVATCMNVCLYSRGGFGTDCCNYILPGIFTNHGMLMNLVQQETLILSDIIYVAVHPIIGNGVWLSPKPTKSIPVLPCLKFD